MLDYDDRFILRKKKLKKTVEDVTGRIYGDLTVIRISDYMEKVSRSAIVECKCSCGNLMFTRISSLRSGHTRSCGCKYGNRLEPTEAAKNLLYYRYKNGAKIRNLPFLLTRDQIIDISSRNCYYCDNPPDRLVDTGNNNGELYSNGIDRKYSDKGYTVDNCVPCCWICNKMKMDMSIDDFLNRIDRIFNAKLQNNL